MTAVGDHAHAEGKLDASYTISFARIRVGEITATVVFGDSEYAISVHGRAGGVMKVLVDGEGSFTTRGTMRDGHPVPINFTSKIVSNAETSDVTMVLDEGSVKELAAAPPPSLDRVPGSCHASTVSCWPAPALVRVWRLGELCGADNLAG
jgi:hypothetical protein